jgi:hypothetical protein
MAAGISSNLLWHWLKLNHAGSLPSLALTAILLACSLLILATNKVHLWSSDPLLQLSLLISNFMHSLALFSFIPTSSDASLSADCSGVSPSSTWPAGIVKP